MTAVERYTTELSRQYNYLPTWYPSIRLSLGDIGMFNNDRIFVPVGKITEQGIDFSADYSPAVTEFSHQSAADFDFHVKLAGAIDAFTPNLPLGSAGIGMRFTGEGALFFQLAGVTHERIGDQITLARDLLRRANNEEWDKDWVVVTEVMRAQTAVILVSESNDGTAELTVNADMSGLGLNALTIEGAASLTHSHSLSTKVTGAAGLTPLFRAVRIKRRWLVGPRRVSPAYAGEVEQFMSTPEPDPSQVLAKLSSYSDVEKEDLG